jgi:hypothetical protein
MIAIVTVAAARAKDESRRQIAHADDRKRSIVQPASLPG